MFQGANCNTIWQKIKYQEADLIDLFFDTSSVKVNENYVYYRTKTDFNGDSSICWIKSDCIKNTTAILVCKPYSKESEDNFYNYKDSVQKRIQKSYQESYLANLEKTSKPTRLHLKQ